MLGRNTAQELAALRRKVAALERTVVELGRRAGLSQEQLADLGEPPIPQEVVDLAHDGKKILAIKVLRERTGMGLREAKETVDRL